MASYRAVVLTGKGGLDKLAIRELPLSEPKRGELRIRVRATGAGATDLIMRTGSYPYAPPFPFSPGYEVVGDVDELGPDVHGFARGQRVCALTVHGGQAEYLIREAEHFVPVPDGLDDAEVVALILNYVTAYQMIHRAAAMKSGQSALVTGANGGVGSAALELLRLLDVKVIGSASSSHFQLLRELGAEPIEARGKSLDEQVHVIQPSGVDASFDGLGGARTQECIRATRPHGIVVGYGFVAAQKNGRANLPAMLRGMAALYVGARLARRRSTFYGITRLYRRDPAPFKQDLPELFALLKARKLQPKIAARLPLLAGVEAQRMLEAGGVEGKIVLLRDAPSQA